MGPGLARGLDVSDDIDPARLDYIAAAQRGFTYLVAKLSDGIDHDIRGAGHLQRGRAAGMTPGGYHFHIPWREVHAQADAFSVAANLAGYGGAGDLWPWLDIESWLSRTGVMRLAEPSWNDTAAPLAEELAKRFGGVVIYLNAGDWDRLGRPDWIERYPLAAPHYTDAPEPLTAGGLPYAFWQHRVAPVPGVYPLAIDQSVARLPLPVVGAPEPPEPPPPARIDVTIPPVRWDYAAHCARRNRAASLID